MTSEAASDMDERMDERTARMRPSARELYHTGSGASLPLPTDADIASAIRRNLAPIVGFDVLDGPSGQIATRNAAEAVRNLFQSISGATNRAGN